MQLLSLAFQLANESLPNLSVCQAAHEAKGYDPYSCVVDSSKSAGRQTFATDGKLPTSTLLALVPRLCFFSKFGRWLLF